MSGSNLTWGGGKHPPSAAPGGKSPVLLRLKHSDIYLLILRLNTGFRTADKEFHKNYVLILKEQQLMSKTPSINYMPIMFWSLQTKLPTI